MSTEHEHTLLPSPHVYYRIASDHDDGGTTNWYELTHAQCAQALPSGSQIYRPGRPPGVFGLDAYDCELCSGNMGHTPTTGHES